MGSDGVRADMEYIRDLLVCSAGDDKGENFDLPGCEKIFFCFKWIVLGSIINDAFRQNIA